MEIRRLEVFCKVIEMKSFSRAAEAVLLSQPSVSEHVRLLEEHFGDKLLDRLGREVLPTPAGKILYQYGRRIIQLRDEAVQSIDHFKGHLGGDLAVGASTIPGCYILPELIVGFRKKHPGIHVMLKISGTSQSLQSLIDGDIELAIVGAKPVDKRLDYIKAFEDELVLTVPAEHPWARRKSVDVSELVQEPFIHRERGSGTRSFMQEALGEQGLDCDRLSVVAEMGSTEAVRQGIRCNLGISVLSALAIREDLELGRLAAVELRGLRMTRPLYLVQRRGRQHSPLGATFLDHLEEQGRKSAR